jgi:transcriptional regulatory protein LevR
MKRNNVSAKNIVNVLRTANDVNNLNQIYSNIKNEIEKLKQIKNNYSLNQNTNTYKQLPPLGLPRYYYENL